MIAEGLTSELKHEFASTRKMLEKVPFESYSWQPHAKSMSLGSLASHVATIPAYLSNTLQHDELDFAKNHSGMPSFISKEEMLAAFNKCTTQAIQDLQNKSDEEMRKPWTLRAGQHIIFTLPKVAAARTLGISHLIHHRGQLSVYLRMLDIPIPGMYGPSADEPM